MLWFIPTICVSVHFWLLRVHFLQTRWGCRARKTAAAHLFRQRSNPPPPQTLESCLQHSRSVFFLMTWHFPRKPFMSDIVLQQQSWKPYFFLLTAAYSWSQTHWTHCQSVKRHTLYSQTSVIWLKMQLSSRSTCAEAAEREHANFTQKQPELNPDAMRCVW